MKQKHTTNTGQLFKETDMQGDANQVVIVDKQGSPEVNRHGFLLDFMIEDVMLVLWLLSRCQLQVVLRLEMCLQCPSVQTDTDGLEQLVEEASKTEESFFCFTHCITIKKHIITRFK